MKVRSTSSSSGSSGPRDGQGAALAADLSPGDVIAGKYRLDRLVGRGGMGSVWAARNEQLGMLVALKFIESVEGADVEDARARFEREARAAAQIRSPHVAQIFEYVSTGDRPFIAMELLDGEDLGERLRREGRLSMQAVSKILTQAAKALRRAHEAGIIHRDLKPGNIFLARFDDDEVVKILDFGVAKVRAAGAIDGPLATQTGIVFGSPSYMSPEQARGVRALDHRSDLWSMAVIVFRAITGVKPFQGSSIGDLVVKLCIDPLPIATAFASHLPPEIDRFFERAFARDPDLRFQSAVDMAAAFEAISAGGPRPEAPPPASFKPMPRIPVQELPPAPPLSASGSGPHVAFASGTLTPPPGAAPDIEPPPRAPPSAGRAPMPSRASYDPSQDAAAVAPARVPSFHEIAPPIAAPAIAAPVIAPPIAPALAAPSAAHAPLVGGAPSAFAPSPPHATSPSASARHLAIGAGIGVGALALLVLVIAIAASKGGAREAAHPIVSATVAAASEPPTKPSSVEPAPPPSATSEPAPAVTASASAEPVASAAPSASADPTAQPAGSAEPDPSAIPRPRTKPGKKRPNFGY